MLKPDLNRVQAELDFFDAVTEVSGRLYPVPKDQRKGAAVDFLRKLEARPSRCRVASYRPACMTQETGSHLSVNTRLT